MKMLINIILMFTLVNQVVYGQSFFEDKDYIHYDNKDYVYLRILTGNRFTDNGDASFKVKNTTKKNIYVFTSSLLNMEEILNRDRLDGCQINTYYKNFQHDYPHSGITKYNFYEVEINDIFDINLFIRNPITETCLELYMIFYYFTLKYNIEAYYKINHNFYLIPLEDMDFYNITLTSQTITEVKDN